MLKIHYNLRKIFKVCDNISPNNNIILYKKKIIIKIDNLSCKKYVGLRERGDKGLFITLVPKVF